MRSLGITRKLDALGRVTLPVELRQSLGYETGTPLEILADDKSLYIKKASDGCTFCHSDIKVVAWHGDRVCRICAADILAKSVKDGVKG